MKPMGLLLSYSEQDLSPTVTEILHVFIVFDAIATNLFTSCSVWDGLYPATYLPSKQPYHGNNNKICYHFLFSAWPETLRITTQQLSHAISQSFIQPSLTSFLSYS